MHISQLIVGSTKTKRFVQARSLAEQMSASSHDIHHIEPSEDTGRIGISAVKSVINALLLSPVAGTIKVCIFHEVHRGTREAQNSLLKLIEEPDRNVLVLMTAPTTRMVLPTITSRCRIVKLTDETPVIDPALTEDVHALMTGSDGMRLALAEKYADREKALAFLEALLHVLRNSLRGSVRSNQPMSPSHIQSIRSLERARLTAQNTNVSKRLLLENVLLEFGI